MNQIAKTESFAPLPIPERYKAKDGTIQKLPPPYGTAIRSFNRWLNEQDRPADLDAVRDYLQHRAKTRSGNTLKLDRHSLKVAIRAAHPEYNDPELKERLAVLIRSFAKPETETDESKRAEWLTHDEVALLIDGATDTLGLIVEFFYNTGVRVSEGLNVKRSDCRLTRDGIAIKVKGKGNKNRTVLVQRNLYKQILDVFGSHRKDFIFHNPHRIKGNYSRQWFEKRLAALGKKELGRHVWPHILRHSAAMGRIRQGWNVSEVSAWLGHASVTITTQIYLHGHIDPAKAAQPLLIRHAK